MHSKKSLKALKNALLKNEEILKRLQKSYPHLAHLSENQILKYFNVQSLHELNKHMKQIKASKEHQTIPPVQKNEVCSCRDSHGQIKVLYDSEASAKEQIDTLSQRKRLQLHVYRCPYGCGWHLTKR